MKTVGFLYEACGSGYEAYVSCALRSVPWFLSRAMMFGGHSQSLAVFGRCHFRSLAVFGGCQQAILTIWVSVSSLCRGVRS